MAQRSSTSSRWNGAALLVNENMVVVEVSMADQVETTPEVPADIVIAEPGVSILADVWVRDDLTGEEAGSEMSDILFVYRPVGSYAFGKVQDI